MQSDFLSVRRGFADLAPIPLVDEHWPNRYWVSIRAAVRMVAAVRIERILNRKFANRAVIGFGLRCVPIASLAFVLGVKPASTTAVRTTSYQLTDNRAIQVSASFGALTGSSDQTTRHLDLDLRVGDSSLDNTHPLREGDRADDFSEQFERQKIPLENDPDALRVALWHETERKYRSALQRLQQVKANVQVKVEAEDRSGDFSHDGSEVYFESPAPFTFDKLAWEKKVRNYTAPFASHKEIIENSAEIIGEAETRRYVNSDGSRIQLSSPFYRLIISAWGCWTYKKSEWAKPAKS
jgi:hypothetical protein